MEQEYTNNLIGETSPYLLQHAHNPVHWHAWNEDALATARRLDKPILISIGYSACHWCHVMERESFEDEEVAEYMNEHFICIKVDREERPDLDKIYQTAHQMLTQRPGGWPLNVVVAPDNHAPFFAGTYFPKVPRYGMPSFKEVLGRVLEYYRDHRQELDQHGEAVRAAFRGTEPEAGTNIYTGALEAAVLQLSDNYDPVHGGFGDAPKFPHPTGLELCLRNGAGAYGQKANPRSLGIAHHSLTAMAEGGLFDQVGGGFCRYAVDSGWAIPHFEKMLYDNAQLLPLYVDGWLSTGDEFFEEVALSTARWTVREMQSPSGGFYSTLDADSEGEEGKFYVWSLEEMREVLSPDEYAVVEVRYNLRGQPNFEGKWHLNIGAGLDIVAQRCSIDVAQARSRLAAAKDKLFTTRESRVRPDRDDKILTSWNAMMIRAMAYAGRRLKQPDLILSATSALDYVRENLSHGNRLFATAKDGRAHLNAYLDDYVLLIDAILELNQARWRSDEIGFAIALADIVLEQFEDKENGGFFFTSNDHEKLLHRSKPATDDATPSGNGVAARALVRLGHLIGEYRYLQSAERALRILSPSIEHYPSAHAALVGAIQEFLSPPQVVIIRADHGIAAEWLAPFAGDYMPDSLIFVIPRDAQRLPGILANMGQAQEATAFVCHGGSCSAPIDNIEQFIATVKERDNNAL